MAFKFRKSIKITKGVKVNIGKKGISSVSVGGKGASVNIGKNGVYGNVSAPGTGLSYRERIDSNSSELKGKSEFSTNTSTIVNRPSKTSKLHIALALIGVYFLFDFFIGAYKSDKKHQESTQASRNSVQDKWDADKVAKIQARKDTINSDLDALNMTWIKINSVDYENRIISINPRIQATDAELSKKYCLQKNSNLNRENNWVLVMDRSDGDGFYCYLSNNHNVNEYLRNMRKKGIWK